MRSVGRRRQRGQSLVEFTMVVPIVLMLVLSIAEFGVAYGTNMSLVEATREGARVGAILGNGSDSLGCASAGSGNVDPQIMLAVQRVVESPGSGITLANVNWVYIYKSDGTGGPTTYDKYTVSVGNGGTICGATLDFVLQGTAGWAASTRSAASPADSLGVMINYSYKMFTPMAAVAGWVGMSTMTMVDSTVMDIEP